MSQEDESFHYLCPGDTLSRSQTQKAELEVEINQLRREEASLRDALLKLQALNEGLGQDKIELNKFILQVCMLNVWTDAYKKWS